MASIIQKRKNQYTPSQASTTAPAPAVPAAPAAPASDPFCWRSVFEVIGWILLGALAIAAIIGIGWVGWQLLLLLGQLLEWLCVVVLPVVLKFVLCCGGGVIAVFLLRSFAFRGTNGGAFAVDIIMVVIVALILMSCTKSC